MAVKLTKRKGFNFFRSYFDVYNELETNEDKVAFMNALLDRQFLGIKPTNLKGMANFAYISQTNSIDSQVKGYEDKTKTKLNPIDGGKNTPCYGGKNPPALQVEEKEEVKEELSIYTEKDFLKNWNEIRTHYLKTPSHLNKLKQDEAILFNDINNPFKKEDYHVALHGLFKQEEIPRDIMRFRPKHFLSNIDTYIDDEKNKQYKLYA